MSFQDIYIVEYSEKSFVVQGETKEHKEDLKKLGGKYNSRLRDGPGWIFSKKKEDEVESYIRGGKILAQSSSGYKSSSSNPSNKEFGILTKKIDNLEKTVKKLEKLILILLKQEEEDSDSESDKERTPVPRRRLLSKQK